MKNFNQSNSKKSAKKSSFEKKEINGKPNPKYIDLLEEDKPISTQKFACISFCSPEKILKQKEIFFFEEFLKKWEINKSMEKFIEFLNFTAYKYDLKFEDLNKDFTDFVEDQKEKITQSSLDDDYKTFIENNESELQNKFDIKNKFQTNIRGIKIRGSYATQEEAEFRCKMLREIDPHHNIFVGPVGLWMPWDPENTERVEYLEEELNQLMHEKKKNETKAKIEFEKRVKETKQHAIEENIKNAEKHKIPLTQGIDENGNLFGLKNMNTQESILAGNNEEVSTDSIIKELFEGDNIVTEKTDNGQSLLLSGPFAIKKSN